ncbi:MAG: MarR family transcriptional regulator [Candidatus Accumulibacter sp.]|jgi:DNA-binding MarR family transcriptional regulator|nr:MarR family transcriptional regulator [Accumulibacter sp.]
MSEPVSSEQLAALFHRTAKGMFRGHRPHDRHGRHEVPEGQTRHAQDRILSILAERESMSQRELLEMLHIRSASLSELVIKLEKHGHIARQRDAKDKRGFLLRLIDSGRAALSAHQRRHTESAANFFSVLTETERNTLFALLNRLLAAWEADEAAREETSDSANGGKQ